MSTEKLFEQINLNDAQIKERKAPCIPDYKKMYLTMVNAAEDAINILIEAQQKCEELYLKGTEDKETSDAQ